MKAVFENKIIVEESAWEFILEATGIKTDLKPSEIGAIKNGKVYGKGLIDLIELIDEEDNGI